jgi:hypothetical protein
MNSITEGLYQKPFYCRDEKCDICKCNKCNLASKYGEDHNLLCKFNCYLCCDGRDMEKYCIRDKK